MNLSDSLNDSLGDHSKITPDLRTLDAEFDTNKYSKNMETSHQNIQKRFLSQMDLTDQENNAIQNDSYSIGNSIKIQSIKSDKETAFKINKHEDLDSCVKKELYAHSPLVHPKLSMGSQSSFKLTYSSDKKSFDDVNSSIKGQRQLTFGSSQNQILIQQKYVQQINDTQISESLQQVEYLIEIQNISHALKLLEQIEKCQMNEQQTIMLNYLYTQAFFEVQLWDEFIYSAEETINLSLKDKSKNHSSLILKTLQMLVDVNLQNNNFESALKYQMMLLEISLSKAKDTIDQHILLGQLNLKLERFQDAYKVFQRAFADPENQQSQSLLMNIYFVLVKLEKHDEILEIGEKLINIIPEENLTEIHLHLAKIYYMKGMNSKASFHQHKGLKIQIELNGLKNIDTCLIMFTYAKILQNEGQSGKAYETYLNVLNIVGQLLGKNNQLYFQCLNHLGFSAISIGQPQQALKHYQAALDLIQNLPNESIKLRVILNIICCQKPPQFNIINQALEILISMNDQIEAGRIANELGNVLVSKEQYRESIELYMISVRKLQGEELIYSMLNLGSSYAKAQDIQQSLNTYNNALQQTKLIQSSLLEIEIEKRLGRTFAQVGRVNEAKFHLDKAILLLKTDHKTKNQQQILELQQEIKNIRI